MFIDFIYIKKGKNKKYNRIKEIIEMVFEQFDLMTSDFSVKKNEYSVFKKNILENKNSNNKNLMDQIVLAAIQDGISKNEIINYLKKHVYFVYDGSERDLKKHFFKSNIDVYIFKERIGKGGNSKVFKVDNSTGKTYSLKLLNSSRSAAFGKEISFLKKHKHSNIIKFIDSGEHNSYVFMVNPIYKETLYDFIERNANLMKNKKYNEVESLKFDNYFSIMFSLLDGLIYCHRKGYYHNDIKEENIFLNDFNNVVVGDFGTIGKKNRLSEKEVLGNKKTSSPEQIMDNKIDMSKTDVYSLGLIFNRLMTSVYPYGTNYEEIQNKKPQMVFIDYIISRMLSQKITNRVTLEWVKERLSFFFDLKNPELFYDYNETKKHINIYKERSYVDTSAYEQIPRNKYTFEVKHQMAKVGYNQQALVYVTDITGYNKNEMKLMDNEPVIVSNIGNNLKNTFFYDMNNFLLIGFEYGKTRSVLFKYKAIIKEHFILCDSTDRDYEVFLDKWSKIHFKWTTGEIEVFTLKYKPYKRKINMKFILINEKNEDNSKLYFMFDDLIFPYPLNKNILNKIKDLRAEKKTP